TPTRATGTPTASSREAETATTEQPACLVVLLALGRVGEHVVGFGNLLETLFGGSVAWVLVRMVASRQLAVCLLDLLGGGVLGDTQDLVVVLLDPVLGTHRHLPS